MWRLGGVKCVPLYFSMFEIVGICVIGLNSTKLEISLSHNVYN